MNEDDDTRKLLKEICEIVRRADARNAAWMDEFRPRLKSSTSVWQKTWSLAIAALFMLVLLLEMLILGKVFGYL